MFIPAQRHQVESAGRVGITFFEAEIVTGGLDKARLLAKIYTFFRCAKRRVSSISDFYEYCDLSVSHDQIDLTTATAVVPRFPYKPALGKPRLRYILETGPANAAAKW